MCLLKQSFEKSSGITPYFEEREAFLFEYGFLTYQNNHWEESHRVLSAYLQTFPKGAYVEDAWKLFFVLLF